MNKEEILKYFKNNKIYMDDIELISPLEENKLEFLYSITLKYGELFFPDLMDLKYDDKSFQEIETKTKTRGKSGNESILAALKLFSREAKSLPTLPLEPSQKIEIDLSVLYPDVEDLCQILGIPSVVGEPNDFAKFIEPPMEVNESNKICLYDFFKYLYSVERSRILLGVSRHMPYYIEKCASMSNKYKALAILESKLFNFEIPDCKNYLYYNPFKSENIYDKEPDTLFSVKIEDIINNPENELNSRLKSMFKNHGNFKDYMVGKKLEVHDEKPKSKVINPIT